jgi:head-tail adaptor
MGLTSLLVHDLTIQRPASAADANGFTVKDWDDPTETSVKGWIVQLSTTEDRDGREAQVSSWQAYLHAETDVLGGDRVVWGSRTFEVDGTPQHAWTPRGEHHVEVQLRKVDG